MIRYTQLQYKERFMASQFVCAFSFSWVNLPGPQVGLPRGFVSPMVESWEELVSLT